jgi:hypothetical protein
LKQPGSGSIVRALDGSSIPHKRIAYIDLINPKYAYRHNGNELNKDSWSLRVCDLDTCSREMVQEIQVNPINDPPQFTTSFYPIFMREDKPYALRFGVQDADNLERNIQVIIQPDRNRLIDLQASTIHGVDLFRSVELIPRANLLGKTELNLGLSDGIDTSWKAIDINISPVNDPPLLQLSNYQIKIGNTEEYILQAKYEDIDSPDQAISLKVGSTDPSLLPDSRIAIRKIVEESYFELTITPKSNLTGFVDLLIECSDESSATASVLQVEINELNDPPMPFQLVNGEAFVRNDSLIASFNWTPAYDPENLEVQYSLFLKSDKRDTVIHNIKNTEFEIRSVNSGVLQSESSYEWYVKATDNHHVNSNERIDSTQSRNAMQFVTPYYEGMPNWAELSRIYPNPFSQVATIEYTLTKDAQVEIRIFDYSGKQIEQIEDRFRSSGRHSVRWDPPTGSNGVYAT